MPFDKFWRDIGLVLNISDSDSDARTHMASSDDHGLSIRDQYGEPGHHLVPVVSQSVRKNSRPTSWLGVGFLAMMLETLLEICSLVCFIRPASTTTLKWSGHASTTWSRGSFQHTSLYQIRTGLGSEGKVCAGTCGVHFCFHFSITNKSRRCNVGEEAWNE